MYASPVPKIACLIIQYSIVISSWKRSLDLVGRLLEAKGIPSVRIDGSQPLSERRRVLSTFHMKPNVTVLLMTLGTGAVG